MIYLLINSNGDITGWTLTREFAERCLAVDEHVEKIVSA